MKSFAMATVAKQIIGQYRQELSKAAGKNGVLSLQEQRGLSPWASKQVSALRHTATTVRVDDAIDLIAGKVQRAVSAIAGPDRKVTRSEVGTLKVAELRARALSLFADEVPAAASRAALDASVKALAIDWMSTNNKSFSVTDYAAGTSFEKILRDNADWGGSATDEEMREAFASGTGAKALAAISKDFSDAGEEIAGNEDDEALGAKIADAYQGVAKAATAYFGSAEFSKVEVLTHAIEEDGDTEIDLIMGTRGDGSMTVLAYTNNPF